ncbi:GNAT family N-acetyltransferase [Curtobacterium sp. MCBA15_009]|uniref:GNAT family N-acetyltransferase n=1 Tax=Curtobacterium sp. MCBA15_009 TaxID=1898737 RepID=UPI0009F636B2|nr:GNAT family N-acetyltransferase [Curtobacterium sp. MCBA15_009]
MSSPVHTGNAPHDMRGDAVPGRSVLDTGLVVRIRQARVEDSATIGLFQTLAWEQTYRGIVPDSFLDARSAGSAAERWAERIDTGSRLVFVAESFDGRVLGVASTSRSADVPAGLPHLELVSLYVDREAHGAGVASSLLTAALAEDDAHLLVFSCNERARRFYAKHGFERRGDQQVDPGTGLHEERWVRQLTVPIHPSR